ncbi:Rv1157c family protein [Corynebacterium sp. 335C]
MTSTLRQTARRTAAVAGAAALLTGLAVPAAGANPLAEGSSSAVPADFAERVQSVLEQPGIPEDIRAALEKGLGSLTGGSSEGGAAEGESDEEGLIPENGPKINQFLPMVSPKCIGGKTPSLGLATSVPGPADLPLPGIPQGQAGFVFTAMGTKGLAETQDMKMNVHWVNPLSGSWGTTTLDRTDLNPDGPGTVWGVGETGSGMVLAVIEGGITAAEESGPSNCQFTPSAAIIPVK